MVSLSEKFIYALDKQTSDKLVEAGLQMVCQNNGQFIFINSPTALNFENLGIDNTKIVYTNALTF